ncbi:MAG: aminotransferase class I/II-fold pyridoxal phosphate-dependent enzyme [Gammaproteobacteria bacterium]|nr:aminotransferase class I/II-fold pyridoxal phosphate-dependent enzyme [Gammaproteobacteria bacterium]MBV8402649.1 aminotransferase class I/II-fold pyridoxal phosphate-dependent enzyme [Gammaproteobacteria bacterium]
MAGKLDDVGTTIFTVVSRRARELDALNLGQGFPDYDIDPRLTELVAAAMQAGHNQYAPMEGLAVLRERIAAKLAARYGLRIDPDAQITVTLGATEAIYSTVQALIGPGDEALAFDPAYDSYEPAVRLAGGRCIRVPLAQPGFRYDWDRVRAALSARTRLVLFNSPHNPACTIAGSGDLDELARITSARGINVLSDEVYEHVVFDGARHASVLAHPELAQRSVAVFSFGKTLHATGLRVGYSVAPAPLTRELRKVHQFNTFSISHPLQHAIAAYLTEQPRCGEGLTQFFQAKRDRLRGALEGSGFVLPPAQGTYFQLLDFSAFAEPDDRAFAERLLNEARVATIPLSPFYARPEPLAFVRLCIAKRDSTLDEAAARLRAFAAAAGRA